ncbi:MAG TPA: ABC transporter substrate-binding protein [Amycolatopsis sp.]|nr:ABC transporter substrate-binding protein [Amycolatopsis sp.]
MVRVFLAAVLGAVLAACGGSTQAGQTGTQGGQNDPIKVGTIQTASGAFGQQIFLTVSTMWENWINANGGINGHPVKLYTLDDGTDPARALSDTKELIDQDGVVAIIGSNSTGASAIQKYAASKGVPIIGGVTAQTVPAPLSFPAGTSLEYLVKGYLSTAKTAGLTKFGAFTCVESAACTSSVTALQSAAPSLGVQLVDTEKVSSTAPDYTAPCLSMIKSGAQAVAYGTSPQIAVKIIQTCLQQGATFATVVNAGTALPAWANIPALHGSKVYIVNEVWPLSQKDTPAQQQFFQAADKYAPGMLTSPEMSAYVQQAWVGMQMFATVAKAGQIGPTSTAADLIKALYTVRDETLGGLTGPTTYTEGATQVNKCYFVTLLENGSYTSPFGAAPQCAA